MKLRNHEIIAYREGKLDGFTDEQLRYLDGEFKKIPTEKQPKIEKPVKEETDLFKDA